MRIDLIGSSEETVRKLSNDLNISSAVIIQILLEIMMEHIEYKDISNMIKLQVGKIAIDRQEIYRN